MKGFDNNWDSYLSKTTSRRDFANTYSSSHGGRNFVSDFFVRASALIERPFRIFSSSNSSNSRSSKKSWSSPSSSVSSPFSSKSSSYSSSIADTSSAHERIDLSGISSEETFVIGGKSQSSSFSRFWKRFKALFKDEKPRINYNARHQFPIRGVRQSAASMARERKRELADSIDLSAIAATIEKGRIK